MRMDKTRVKKYTYRYECPKCHQAFTELNDKGTIFCDCDMDPTEKNCVMDSHVRLPSVNKQETI